MKMQIIHHVNEDFTTEIIETITFKNGKVSSIKFIENGKPLVMSIASNTEKLNTIKDLVSQFTNGFIKWPRQLERKVAKVLELPKGYSEELYYERLKSLSAEISENGLSN